MEGLREISEAIRQQLYALESIRNQATELKPSNKAEGKLKERLKEYLSTATADLLIVSDFLYEAENCYNESDIEFLLEISDENFAEDYN